MRVSREQGVRFLAECRGHRIVMDQPKEQGGGDTGMTPPELLAASLAGCIAYYVTRYCEQAKIDAEGLRVECDWQVGGEPKRVESFDVQVILPHCPPGRRKAVERVANACLVHRTLCGQPRIRIAMGGGA